MNLKSLVYLAAMVTITPLVTSCSSTPEDQQSNSYKSPAPSSSWAKAQAKPPTWYPKGVNSNCSTDFSSGEWVYTKDIQDTRYFIPIHGISSDLRIQLRNEALAARHPSISREIKIEENKRVAKSIATKIIATPFMIFHRL